jgi:threonine dehydratase
VIQSDAKPTLSDGTAGSMAPGSITIPLCRDLVDEWPLVSETEIASAMRRYISRESQLIEGAAGVAIAGFLQAAAARPADFDGTRVVIIICGGRIDSSKLVSILRE